MQQETIKLAIPFESLTESIANLNRRDKQRLFDWLEEQISQAEEERWERSPKFRAEIREARTAYKAGNYLTIDQYNAKPRGKRK